MRKLFFLLVLASGMLVAQTPNATNTQTIGKFLKLSKVPLGLETDNVLVRGTNGIVKFVPRSEFGGGTPDLQQVLAKNNTVTGNTSIIMANSFDDSFRYETSISPSMWKIRKIFNNSQFIMNADGIQFYNPETGGGNRLGFYTSNTANKSFYFPDKPSGDYTLATLDDIPSYTVPTLQDVVTKSAQLDGGSAQAVVSNASGSMAIIRALTDAYDTESGVVSIINGKSAFVGAKNGKTDIFENQLGLSTHFVFADPIAAGAGAIIQIPAKTEGTYTIATTDDIKLKEYTVSTLPAGTKGDVAYVNDASSPAFLATVVGGGFSVVRVFYNGTNWIVQ